MKVLIRINWGQCLFNFNLKTKTSSFFSNLITIVTASSIKSSIIVLCIALVIMHLKNVLKKSVAKVALSPKKKGGQRFFKIFVSKIFWENIVENLWV